MFPCSTLQKPDWEQFFPDRPRHWLGDAKLCIQTHTPSIPCEALARPVRRAYPWQFLPTASSHWEKDAQERLSRTSLFLELLCSEKNYLTKQVTSPAVAPLLTCSFLPLPHLHTSPIFWPHAPPLPCLESALNTISPFLPVFPLLLSPRATVNLVLLAVALFDSESSSPQLGWALLEAQRRKPRGWKGEINLQQQQFTPGSKTQEIIFPHLDHWSRERGDAPLLSRVAIGVHLKLLGEVRVEVGEHWCAPAPSFWSPCSWVEPSRAWESRVWGVLPLSQHCSATGTWIVK